MAVIRNDSGAVFTACRRWRYLLWRRWDRSIAPANFLLLNRPPLQFSPS